MHYVGQIYIPGLNEQERFSRTYAGYGDPNLLPADYFDPKPRPNDIYMQLDADPIIQWVYTKYRVWTPIGLRYDPLPPDFTLIYDIITGE
jgi:hypothetical protein